MEGGGQEGEDEEGTSHREDGGIIHHFALLPSLSHGGGGGGVKGHFLPTEENIMYLKKERSILLGAADCAVGAGPQIVSL